MASCRVRIACHTGPVDFLGQAVGLLLCLGHATADSGGTEYAAAGSDYLTLGIQSGARVEHLAIQLGCFVQSLDHVALGGFA